MSIKQVAVVSVPVSDQERAKEFYVDALGFELQRDDTSVPGLRWLQVGPQGASTTLTMVTWFESMPAGWKPVVETPDEIRIAFWERGEFLAYVAHAKPTKKVVWAVPNYARYAYHLGFAAVERHDLAAAERWVDRSLALEA